MNRIAVLADRVTAEIFRATDFHIIEVEPDGSVWQQLEELLRQPWEIIFITENLAETVQSGLSRYQQGEGAIVVIIPGVGTRKHLGTELMKAMEKSVIGI